MKTFIVLLSLGLSLFCFANESETVIKTQEDKCILVTNENLCVQISWTQGPYVGAFSKNTVKFKDLTKSTQTKSVYRSPKKSIQFFGWMVMQMGSHGTRPVATKVVEPGVYENSKIFYMDNMKGTWQFKLKLGNEEFVLHTLDI